MGAELVVEGAGQLLHQVKHLQAPKGESEGRSSADKHAETFATSKKIRRNGFYGALSLGVNLDYTLLSRHLPEPGLQGPSKGEQRWSMTFTPPPKD
jgi:hypothetical protein